MRYSTGDGAGAPDGSGSGSAPLRSVVMVSALAYLRALSDRLRRRSGGGGLLASLFRTGAYRMTLKRRPADSIRPVWRDTWPADPAKAQSLLDGTLPFFGRALPLAGPTWAEPPSGVRAAGALHGFAWLGDLAGIGTDPAMARARDLVEGWISHDRACAQPAWRADVLGRRLTAWMAASERLLAGADETFRRRFLESASMQARHLARVAPGLAGDAGAFAAAKGWIAAALCLGIGDLERSLAFLAGEIDRQVLPDGGHAGRNPQVHADVLRDLLDIRDALAAGGAEVPPAVQGGIDRMTPMLRALRHGDGGLAVFHGGYEGDRQLCDAILARAAVKGKAPGGAPYTGFQRLAAGRTVVIVDAGAPPALGGGTPHAGPLALEISDGRHRMVVNCGVGGGDDAEWQRALRATAAHSTIGVDDTDATDVSDGAARMPHPLDITAERREADGATWLDASHDGYRRRFGLVHHRRLYIDASGGDVRGEDVLDGAGGQGFRARFHLHPDVKASIIQDGAAVLLRLPAGAGWRFIASGGALGVEESIYLGAGGRPRRAEQIVVRGSLAGAGARLKWAFRREGDKR